MSKLPIEYLRHILEETNYILSSTEDVFKDDFLNDPTLQRAIVRSLEIIGEAAKGLPDDFRNLNKKIEWKNMMRMRDKLIHHYFGVDYDIVWDIIRNEIPKLRKEIVKIIECNE